MHKQQVLNKSRRSGKKKAHPANVEEELAIVNERAMLSARCNSITQQQNKKQSKKQKHPTVLRQKGRGGQHSAYCSLIET